jgi:hypothetical protein
MSELQDAARMLEEAEQAARADDLALADQLLRGAARIQEAELGSLHPDLANTLNNLAIVAEKTGRLDDAETFYRRAVAIASASLPADHPMIAASRENLEAFCGAHGLPVDTPAFVALSPPDTAAAPDASVPEGAAVASETPADVFQPPPRRASRPLAWVAIGVVVVLATAAYFVTRSWSSRETSTPAPTVEPLRPPAAEGARPPSAAPQAPIEQVRPPAVVPPGADRDTPTVKPPASTPAAGATTVATAQLCGTFSTSGASWRCDPAADPVPPGPLVLYTRVRSPRDAVVVHRWYRGDTLRQSVTLAIRANATEGYRTYSRQTVDGGADWRVEVSDENGGLLHERRFAVR